MRDDAEKNILRAIRRLGRGACRLSDLQRLGQARRGLLLSPGADALRPQRICEVSEQLPGLPQPLRLCGGDLPEGLQPIALGAPARENMRLRRDLAGSRREFCAGQVVEQRADLTDGVADTGGEEAH